MTRPVPPRYDYSLIVASVTDGDTIRAHLSRSEEQDGDEDFTATLTRRSRDPRGLPIRVLWVDTPELRSKDPEERAQAALARADTIAWLAAHVGKLRVETAGRDDLSRHLGDIYAAGDRSNTLSQHLIRDRGWPVFEENA